MVTPAAIDQLLADWLRTHERAVPTDRALAAFIDGLPLPAQRRAARLFARGFLRGCAYCADIERERAVADLGAVAERLRATLDLVESLRGPPPGSTTPAAGDAP